MSTSLLARKRKSRHALRLLFISAAAAPAAALAAASTDWTGNIDSSWSNASNWDNGVPTSAGENVNILSTADTVDYDYGVSPTLGNLTINTALSSNPAVGLAITDNSTLSITAAAEFVGDSGVPAGGHGLLTQSTGINNIAAGNLSIATTANDVGSYSLSGSATLNLANANSSELIGDGGAGMFTQTGGANNNQGALYVGNSAGSTGTYTQSAGTNSTTSVYLGYSAGASGTYTLSGGTLSLSTSTGVEYVGYNGTGSFVQSGGLNATGTTGGLVVANSAQSSGSYTLSGTGVLSVGVGEENICGSFVQTDGTNMVVSANSNPAGLVVSSLDLQGTATYTLSGGSLRASGAFGADFELIGNGPGGNGAFVQTGGTNTNDLLSISGEADSQGYYTLGGTGILTCGGPDGGFEEVGYRGTGTFIQTGGVNTISSVGALEIATPTGSTGTYAISGGTLSTPTVDVGPGFDVGPNAGVGGMGTLNVSGGTVTVAYVLTLFPSGTYSQTGGSATINRITAAQGPGPFVSGGTVTITGGKTTLTANGGLSTVAALNVNGTGTLDITNNAIVVNYASPATDPVASIKSALMGGAAFNGRAATWSGTGIMSSLAAAAPNAFTVGYLDGNNQLDKQYGTVSANQILVAYALAGDAFLEGSVGFRDLLIVAGEYQRTGLDYAEGNFFYNPQGSVGFADLLAVAQHYGQSYAIAGESDGASNTVPLAWQSAPSVSAVPEPTTVAIAAAGSAIMLARRKRSTRRPSS